jgi:hypothetical protein
MCSGTPGGSDNTDASTKSSLKQGRTSNVAQEHDPAIKPVQERSRERNQGRTLFSPPRQLCARALFNQEGNLGRALFNQEGNFLCAPFSIQ